MKFLLPIAVFAIAGVSAQDKKCLANYIVDRCLSTETEKVSACSSTDYDCQCAAYEAVATCYNNCPEDPRASSANQQVSVFCQNASLYGTKTKTHSKTATSSGATTTATDGVTTTTSDGASPTNTSSFSADKPDNTGGAAGLVGNTGGLMAAVAAIIAAVL